MQDKGFLFGLDLGQSNDFTAAAIVQRFHETSAEAAGGELGRQRTMENALRAGRRAPSAAPYVPLSERRREYHVRHVERWPLGTPYTAIVNAVSEMLNRPELRGRTRLVLDKTGVGAAVFDLFTAIGVQSEAITITSGDRPHRQPGGWSVPKKDLAGVLQATLGTGRLKFAAELPERDVLRSELQAFEVRVTAAGNAQYAADWRSGQHDDVVLALACALWYGESGGGVDPDAFRPVLKK